MSLLDELLKAFQADQELNAGGSVMGSAKAGPRADRQSQGPLMAALSQLINFTNPADWMGGFGGAAAATGAVRKGAKPIQAALADVVQSPSAPTAASPFRAPAPPQQQYYNLSPSQRSFRSAGDLQRTQAGEQIPDLGNMLPQRPTYPPLTGEGQAETDRLLELLSQLTY